MKDESTYNQLNCVNDAERTAQMGVHAQVVWGSI